MPAFWPHTVASTTQCGNVQCMLQCMPWSTHVVCQSRQAAQEVWGVVRMVQIAGEIATAKCIKKLHTWREEEEVTMPHIAESLQNLLCPNAGGEMTNASSIWSPPVPASIPLLVCPMPMDASAPISSISQIFPHKVAFWDPPATQNLLGPLTCCCAKFIDMVDNYMPLLHQGPIENMFLDEIESVLIKDICIAYAKKIFELFELEFGYADTYPLTSGWAGHEYFHVGYVLPRMECSVGEELLKFEIANTPSCSLHTALMQAASGWHQCGQVYPDIQAEHVLHVGLQGDLFCKQAQCTSRDTAAESTQCEACGRAWMKPGQADLKLSVFNTSVDEDLFELFFGILETLPKEPDSPRAVNINNPIELLTTDDASTLISKVNAVQSILHNSPGSAWSKSS
ncbi:hypothetical protein K438DRAFT_1759089 [Mycena galopus ATCC 62051]|nr:hypothetical protein K438DRAFT_1759089 [Mycena galopus ATCC 62051]